MSKILKSSSQGDLNGFLDAGCEVRGDLRFEKTFRIHGHFKGTVETDGELIVGEGGFVEGVLKVGELSVSGRLQGQIQASRRIEIGVDGHVEGEIRSPVLVIASGAFFKGKCNMSPSGAAPAAPAAPTAPTRADGGEPASATEDADPALQRFALSDSGPSSAESDSGGGRAGRQSKK